jgi:vacuolar-type H+-ATPase catalytic subunit A/Vma1
MGGDYCGSTHHIANARYLLSRFSSPELRECSGGYGSQGVVVDPRYLSEELLELLQSLESYPVICEDKLSSYELELQNEAWEHTVRKEWERALESALSELSDNEELAESIVESLSEDALFSLFSECCELSNTYWEAESGTSIYIDIDRISQSLSEELLLPLLSSSASEELSRLLSPLL